MLHLGDLPFSGELFSVKKQIEMLVNNGSQLTLSLQIVPGTGREGCPLRKTGTGSDSRESLRNTVSLTWLSIG